MQIRTESLTWQVAGDDVVVLDLAGSVYLKLNGSGRVLWESLAESCDEGALVTTLMQQYGIDEARAITDVAAFVKDLSNRGLLA